MRRFLKLCSENYAVIETSHAGLVGKKVRLISRSLGRVLGGSPAPRLHCSLCVERTPGKKGTRSVLSEAPALASLASTRKVPFMLACLSEVRSPFSRTPAIRRCHSFARETPASDPSEGEDRQEESPSRTDRETPCWTRFRGAAHETKCRCRNGTRLRDRQTYWHERVLPLLKHKKVPSQQREGTGQSGKEVWPRP